MDAIDHQKVNVIREKVSELKIIDTLNPFDIEPALNKLGMLIDYSNDLGDIEGLRKAIDLANTIPAAFPIEFKDVYKSALIRDQRYLDGSGLRY